MSLLFSSPESSGTLPSEISLVRPPARLLQAIQEPVGTTIPCAWCATPFLKRRKKQLHCSPSCYWRTWHRAHPRKSTQ